MSPPPFPTSADERIDRACDEFERRWLEGGRPRLEDFLTLVDEPLRETLWAELLRSELECRRRGGEAPREEEYRQRFPERQEAVARLFGDLGPMRAEGGADTAPAAPPRLLGGYELLEEIARGGMGVVYRARQVALGRVVAVKVILGGDHIGPVQRGRFRTEALAVARLQHPNIVQAFEVGEADGLPFLSMEFVAGPSLARALARCHARGTVGASPEEAARLVEALARAAEFAHSQGVVHRDIKPANVLLAGPAADDEQPRLGEYVPRLTDFGLAKLLDGGGDLTRTGARLGTPSYMAPEQAEGDTDKVGPAADVWALGAVLYELLTGRPPFRAATVYETLWQVREAEPAAPSRVQPGVPRDLETVCLKCLQKQPEKRYPSAGALADDLRRYLNGEPIQARPISAVERAVKWARRYPVVASLLGLVVFVTSLGFAGVTWKWYDEAWQREQAELAEGRARESAKQANEAREQEKKARFEAERTAAFHGVARAELEWRAGNVDRARQALEDCPAATRFWEWHYLRAHISAPHRAFAVQTDAPDSAFSPDGRRLAVAGGGRIRVWDVATGKEVRSLPGACGLSFSADGKYLTTSDEDRVGVWALDGPARKPAVIGREGKLVWMEPISSRLKLSRYGAVALSPDAKFVATASREGGAILQKGGPTRIKPELKIWDVATGKLVRALEGHTSAVVCLCFSADGTHLASGEARGELKAWRRETGAEVAKLSTPGLRALAFSPGGEWLAVADHNQVRLWQWARGGFVALAGETAGTTALAFDASRPRLIAAGRGRVVRGYDTASGRELFALRGHDTAVGAVCFQADGRPASACRREARVWEKSQSGVRRFGGHKGAALCLAFSPDGKRLASGGADGQVLVRRVGDGAVELSLKPNLQPAVVRGALVPPTSFEVTSACFSPGGRRLATACGGMSLSAQVGLWRLADGKPLVSLRGPNLCPLRVAFHPGGKQVVTCGGRGRVIVWDAESGREVGSLQAHRGPVYGLAFSADGARLATGSQGPGEAKVWDFESRRELLSRAGGKWVNDVAFAPDGGSVAWAGGDGAALWGLKEGRARHVLRGHDGPVACVAFHPTDPRLATAGRGRTVKVWDTDLGRPVLALEAASRVNALAFSPDGAFLAGARQDGVVEVWGVANR